MTRIAPLALLVLAGCASDFTLQTMPPEAPLAEAPPGTSGPSPISGPTDPVRPPQPPGNGPWGNLNPGDLPEIYFAVAYSDQACEDVDGDGADPGEDGLPDDPGLDDGEDVVDDEPPDADDDSWYECPSRLAVIDLMGQVIAEFPLPGETDTWTPWSYLTLSAAGPGQFLAVMETFDVADGDDADADGFWQGRPWHALLGDAVTGQIETVAQWDLGTSQVLMTATGELIDLGSWNAFANLAIAPTMPDRLMMWSGTTDCSEMQSLRATHLQGQEDDLVWTASELLPADLLPADGGKPRLWPWNLDGGYDSDGTSRMLLGVTDDGCGDTPGTYKLVAWSPKEGALWHQPAAAQGWTWPPTASWAGHDGGAALELLWGYNPEQYARVISEEGVVEALLPADPEIQLRHAGPMLDAAGPTFVTIGRRVQPSDYRDVLEIHHEGAVVWTIEGLRFGLAERGVFFHDVALLVPLPKDG